MTAGSGSGEGRLEKTELQENKRKRVAKQVGGAMGTRINPLTGQEETDWSQYNLMSIPNALYGAYTADMQKLGAGTGMGAAQTNPNVQQQAVTNVAGQNQGMSTIQQLVAQNQTLAAQQEAAAQIAAQQQAALAAQRQIAQQQVSQGTSGMSNPAYRQSIMNQQRIQRDIDANTLQQKYNVDYSKYLDQPVSGVGALPFTETNPFGLTEERRKELRAERSQSGRAQNNQNALQYALMNQQKQAQNEMLRQMKLGKSPEEAAQFVQDRFAADYAHIRQTLGGQGQASQAGTQKKG